MKVSTLVQLAALLIPVAMTAPAPVPEAAPMDRDDHHHCRHNMHYWPSDKKCHRCPWEMRHDDWDDEGHCHRCPHNMKFDWPHDNDCHKCPWDNPYWHHKRCNPCRDGWHFRERHCHPCREGWDWDDRKRHCKKHHH